MGMTPPLTGVRVLDFTQAAGGPFGTQLLGDMGADVIKVEPLTGDHFRPVMQGVWNVALNRNKRGITVDLRKPEGREIALKLAEGADVLFEAFVPGTMDKLGLGYDVVNAIN